MCSLIRSTAWESIGDQALTLAGRLHPKAPASKTPISWAAVMRARAGQGQGSIHVVAGDTQHTALSSAQALIPATEHSGNKFSALAGSLDLSRYRVGSRNALRVWYDCEQQNDGRSIRGTLTALILPCSVFGLAEMSQSRCDGLASAIALCRAVWKLTLALRRHCSRNWIERGCVPVATTSETPAHSVFPARCRLDLFLQNFLAHQSSSLQVFSASCILMRSDA